MIDNNEVLIKKIIDFETKKGENANKKYLHGECDILVYYLKLLNNQKGERVRIFQEDPLDEWAGMLHFVYKSELGEYYDITGKYNTVNDLIEKSSLYSELGDITIYSEEVSINDLDISEEDKEFKDIEKIITIKINLLNDFSTN